MSLQQSTQYKTYIERLGWSVKTIDGTNVFMKTLLFVGCFAKIQRPTKLPYLPLLIPFLKVNAVTTVIVEPDEYTNPHIFHAWYKSLSVFFHIRKDYFIPTKTIIIDVKKTPEEQFKEFTEAKQRAVRKAQKNNITITESKNIQDLIAIKSKSAGMFGGMTTYGIDKLWDILGPKHRNVLIAKHGQTVVGGILLLFWENTAYYWIAGATKQGKKYAAPTLLVFEALNIARKEGSKKFDFVGVWDERIPKQNTAWKGFTKFKEGFGGYPLYYPLGLHSS